MNFQNTPLYLPILRKDNVADSLLAKFLPLNAAYIWPGLEHMPKDYWQPNNYPFAPKAAKACLNDLHAMSEAALFGMPIHSIMGGQDQRIEAKNIQEQNTLAQFANTGETQNTSPTDDTHILQAAQKIILWAWLLEERFYEINGLTQSYSQGIKGLADALGVEHDEDFGDLERIETSINVNESLMPPWKLVFENIAVFLPQPCTVVVNHQDMVAHIYDTCKNITPLNDGEKYGITDIANFMQCSAEVATILNKNARQRQAAPWLAKKLHFIFLEKT